MNTLTISNIFANFSFYKENYLSFIQDPKHYFTPVEHAYIDAWPTAKRSLVLGDLLQLWFSEKWLCHTHIQGLFDVYTQKHVSVLSQDVYIYQITGNILTGANRSKAWSVKQQSRLDISLDSVVKFYVECRVVHQPQCNIHLQHRAV